MRVNNTQIAKSGQIYARDYVIDYTSGDENNDIVTYVHGEYYQQQVYLKNRHNGIVRNERLMQLTDTTAAQSGNGGQERKLYIHEDPLGTTKKFTKGDGTEFSYLKYDAWGLPVQPNKLVNNDHGNFIAAGFTGHPYDTVLDFYFAEARFYDPLGRIWTARDPAKDGLNWYRYVENNPATYDDLSGTKLTGKNVSLKGLSTDNMPIETAIYEGLMLVSDVLGLTDRWDAMVTNPNPYTIGNALTLGSVELVAGAVNPKNPGSIEHWVDSALTAISIFGIAGLFGKATTTSRFAKVGCTNTSTIMAYDDLRKITSGTNLQAHHLLEKRFAKKFNLKEGEILSIPLDSNTHQSITTAMRNEIGYNGSGAIRTTSTATTQEVWDATVKVYKDKGMTEYLEPLKKQLIDAGNKLNWGSW